ncbi:SMI1/KNR4 family protein [Roseateles sp. DXS20W]|uniref:SMI1/KNR4 family protein n=1 Tax=Pelomonas lactea TaxID=3299030 RepID=A0ABW7GFL3_9BURK
MEQPTTAQLLQAWKQLPESIRYQPATQPQIDAFESQHGPIPPTYREFLLQFGGGAVGSEWLDGVDQLANTHAKFRRERSLHAWRLDDAFVIGWDGAGNPLAISREGAVVVEDHNFGGVHRLASSLMAYVARGLGHAL